MGRRAERLAWAAGLLVLAAWAGDRLQPVGSARARRGTSSTSLARASIAVPTAPDQQLWSAVRVARMAGTPQRQPAASARSRCFASPASASTCRCSKAPTSGRSTAPPATSQIPPRPGTDRQRRASPRIATAFSARSRTSRRVTHSRSTRCRGTRHLHRRAHLGRRTGRCVGARSDAVGDGDIRELLSVLFHRLRSPSDSSSGPRASVRRRPDTKPIRHHRRIAMRRVHNDSWRQSAC